MAAADVPAERTLFVRKATGLVKGWSVFDAFIYSAFAINLMALGFGYAFTGIAVFPEGANFWRVVLHAGSVVMEGAVMIWLTGYLAKLLGENDQALSAMAEGQRREQDEPPWPAMAREQAHRQNRK